MTFSLFGLTVGAQKYRSRKSGKYKTKYVLIVALSFWKVVKMNNRVFFWLIVTLTLGITPSGAFEGENTFVKKCGSCHQVGDGAKNDVGPHLNGLLHREIGTVRGFRYGSGLKAAQKLGKVWTENDLLEWLKAPPSYARILAENKAAKTKMLFKPMAEAEQLLVINYLYSYA
jgi:cytochrome c2